MREDSAGKSVNERYLYGNKKTVLSRLGSAETGVDNLAWDQPEALHSGGKARSISHLFAVGVQRDPEQLLCSLAQKVWVQHSDLAGVTQPDLGRRLPKAFSNLEGTHIQTRGNVFVGLKG